MKINFKKTISYTFGILSILSMTSTIALAAGPKTINLGTAGKFEVLTKTGISTTGTTLVVGDMGVSPAAATYITGFALTLPVASPFSTSALVVGKIYAPGYTNPTPANLSKAVSNMETAYTDGAGRTNPTATELGAGNIGGMTLAPGLYKWGTGVTITSDVTLSGTAKDIWIFQIAKNLDVSSAKKVILSGGAQAGNIFWIVAGQTTLGTMSVLNGNVLCKTAIVLNTGAKLYGRALAQTAVTLDSNSINLPVLNASDSSAPDPLPMILVSTSTPSSTSTVLIPAKKTSCVVGGCSGEICANASTSPVMSSCIYRSEYACYKKAQCEVQTSGRCGWTEDKELKSCLKDKSAPHASSSTATKATSTLPSSSDFGQQVKAIATNFVKGVSGNDISALQQFLISQNKGPSAQALEKVGATSYFGDLTQAALAEFQTEVGISPALGNFGSTTRAFLNLHY